MEIQQPKYKFGQKVKVIVETEHKETGNTFKNQVEAYISVIRMAGTSEKNSFEYGVTTDMPRCYHNGKPPFKFIFEDAINLVD